MYRIVGMTYSQTETHFEIQHQPQRDVMVVNAQFFLFICGAVINAYRDFKRC